MAYQNNRRAIFLFCLIVRRGEASTPLCYLLSAVIAPEERHDLAKMEVGQRHLYPDEIKLLKEIPAVPYEKIFPPIESSAPVFRSAFCKFKKKAQRCKFHFEPAAGLLFLLNNKCHDVMR